MAENRPYDPDLPLVPCTERPERGWFTSAPYRSTHRIALPVSPERLFEVFEDPETWPRWAVGIGHVEWTSPRPFGPGTTRTVTFWGGIKVYEDFHVWEPPRSMAFSFYGQSEQIFASFAEHYTVEPAGGGCHFTWEVAYAPAGHFAWFHPWCRPMMRLSFWWYLRRLRALCRRLPAASSDA